MRWYPWLRPYFEDWLTGYRMGRRHHALFVYALKGMGADALIYAFMRFLMCYQPEPHRCCTKCRSCHLMQAGTHPDYHVLKPESGEELIGIDVIRNVSEKLYEYPRLGNAKVVWLFDATLLTESASNALLKIFEEPPEKTWFFSFCYDPERLLTTLRSRSCFYRLSIPQEKWSVSWLQKKVTIPGDVAITALRLCSGAPGAALELLIGKNWIWRIRLCLALRNALESNDWLSLLAILDHKQFSARLRWLITLLLDALKIQQGGTLNVITNVDVLLLVKRIARTFTGTVLHAIIRSLSKCRKQLLTINSLNRELLLTDRLLVIEHYSKSDDVF